MQAASTSFTNAFMQNLLFQDEVSAAQFNTHLNQGGPTFRFGADYDAGAEAKLSLRKSNHYLLLSIRDKWHADAEFQRSTLQLMALGNAPFAGQQLELGQNTLNSIRLQSVGVGYAFTPTQSWLVGVTGHLLTAQNTLQLNVSEASMYTSNIGDTLRMTLTGQLNSSDTSLGLWNPAGVGAAISVEAAHGFNWIERDWRLSIGIHQLGWVNWQPHLRSWQVDTTAELTGVEVADIGDAGSEVSAYFEALGADMDLLEGRERFNQLVPGNAIIEMKTFGPEGLGGGAGMMYRWRSKYSPYVFALLGYHFNERCSVFSELGYGGYAGFQAAIQVQYDQEKFGVRFDLRQLEGQILPNRVLGVGALFKVYFKLP